MNRKNILCSLILLFFFTKGNATIAFNSCESPRNHMVVDFDSILSTIDREINGDWEPAGKLLSLSDFNDIYNNPLRYIVDIKKTFARKDISETKKMICLYGVQKLGLEDYLALSNYCLSLVNKGELSERVFYFILFPDAWDTDIRFAENYKVESVRAFLKAVIINQKLPWRKSIKSVLNGKMLKDRKRMAKEEGP